MYIVVFTSLLALLFTYFDSTNKFRGGMKLGFVLVTLLGVIHYDYGNDYMPYYELSKQITSYSFDFSQILAGDIFKDSGWVLLCWFFNPIGGFFMMVAILNIIQNFIVYKFIKNNIERSQWLFAVFVYLFVTAHYLMSFSMMRQMFVMIVFLGMWDFIIQRKWWVPLIVFYFCSFIHGSAMILLPFAFWGFIPMQKTKYIGVGYGVLLLVLWFFQNILNELFQYALTLDDTFSGFANRYDKGNAGLVLGIGFVINMIPFILSIVFLLSSSKNNYSYRAKSLVALGAISFLIIPFSQIIRAVSRIGMYFGIFTIASLPLIYGSIKNREIRYGLTFIYIFITMYDYYLFFTNSVFSEKYSIFHTIFSHL